VHVIHVRVAAPGTALQDPLEPAWRVPPNPSLQRTIPARSRRYGR
jgi:hypothetical protein